MTKASFCGSCLLLGKPEFGRGLLRTWGGGSVGCKSLVAGRNRRESRPRPQAAPVGPPIRGGLTGPNWLARAPVCRRLEESDTNYLPPRRCFVWDHVKPPPQKELLACFEVGGWLAHRGGTCELRRGEGEGERTAAGGCPATAAGEGDTGPDFKSLRARAPCQVRAVHRVGRP